MMVKTIPYTIGPPNDCIRNGFLSIDYYYFENATPSAFSFFAKKSFFFYKMNKNMVGAMPPPYFHFFYATVHNDQNIITNITDHP